jgi:hypothetical protein
MGAEELRDRILRASTDAEALAAVEALGGLRTIEAAEYLATIAAQNPPKPIQKAIGKALHRLKSSGLSVEQPPVVARLPVSQYRPIQGYATPIDSAGERMVWIVVEHLGGCYLFMAHVSETIGFRDCSFASCGRQKIAEWVAEAGTSLVQIAPPHALFLVQEAGEIGRSTGSSIPEAFREFEQRVLSSVPAPSEPSVVYELIPQDPEGSTSYSLAGSGRLLGSPEFAAWMFPPQAMETAVARYREVRNAPIVLPDHMQRKKQEDLEQEAMQQVYSSGTLARFRRRMEEMAYILWQVGSREDAQRALAVASALKRSRGPAEIPFLRDLFRQSYEKALLAAGLLSEEEKEGRTDRPPGFKRTGPLFTP